MSAASLRKIPSVEKLTQALGDCDRARPIVVALVRRQLARMRKDKRVLNFDATVQQLRSVVDDLRQTKETENGVVSTRSGSFLSSTAFL